MTQTTMKLVLGLVGEIATGKTTLTNHLKEKYGAVTFRFSDMLRDMVDRLHLPQSRENLQTLSTAIRTHFGEDIMSRTMMEDVKLAIAPIIIIEGVRRPSDAASLKQLPNFHLIAISADPRTRFERLTQRSENSDDQQKTWEDFQKDLSREAEQEIGAIAKEAEATLENNSTREALYTRIEEVLRQFGY